MKYQNVASVTSHYSYPIEKIGVIIAISLERELGAEEGYELQRIASSIAALLRKNTVLNNENEKFNRQLEKEQLIACFSQPIYVKEIPNEYLGADAANPWFIVTTSKGPIKIGWRKRVIQIDWSESDIELNGDSAFIFMEEDVTKGYKYIHAWGLDKAKEYISKLLQS